MATATISRADLRIQQRWIPKGSTEVRHALGVCYTEDIGRNGRELFTAIAYNGTSSKRAFYESYRTREARDKRVRDFFAGLESHAVMMTDIKVERSKPHTLAVGDIIHHSWGWDQTNCDYYQVIAVTDHGATVREIASKTVSGGTFAHGMAGYRTAVKDGFCNDAFRIQVDGSNHVRSMSKGPLAHGSANKWDGQPDYCSWYA